MASTVEHHDDALVEMLIEEKSIIGFLTAIFGFLARRTDFYYVPEGAYENIGFPPGVAEELVIKVLRKCDPKMQNNPNPFEVDASDDLLPTTAVAQEVEIPSENISQLTSDLEQLDTSNVALYSANNVAETQMPVEEAKRDGRPKKFPDPDRDPRPAYQADSESYNGAVRENYSWSQKIGELDITLRLPPGVKTAKDLQVDVTSEGICILSRLDHQVILKDLFSYKIKTSETLWTIAGGQLFMHLEKQRERWWDSLLKSEAPIDLSRIDCSRPLDELPEDHIAKVRELQWNHEQKMLGKPTSDDIKKMEVLKKAWDLDGSPFKGQPFDPDKVL